MDEKQRSLIVSVSIALLGVGGYYFFAKRQPASRPAATSQTTQRPATEVANRNRLTDERIRAQQTASITTDDFSATLSNVGGGLTHFIVRGEKYATNGRPADLVTTDRPQYRPLRVTFDGARIDDDEPWTITQRSPRAVDMRLDADGLRIERAFEAGSGRFELWQTVRVTNTSTRTRAVRPHMHVYHYVPRAAEGGGFFSARSPAISNGICRAGNGDLVRKDRDKLETRHGYSSPGLAGIESTYFARMLAPVSSGGDGLAAERCALDAESRSASPGTDPIGTLFHSGLTYPRLNLEPGASRTFRTLAYFGPKEPPILQRAGHHLEDVVDLGFFSVIARGLVGLLSAIHRGVGNWGLAIILLTVLVKVVLFPLTQASFQSMARMRQLKPEMDRLNELYPNPEDREKKGAATLELYRKHKINPASGCLPQLLQLPIWWALYQSLSTNVELLHASFIPGWLDDLAAPDPFYVMPLLLGLLMFVQQKMTPTTMDPVQAKVMLYMMPIMITSFMLFLPSGLTVYMFTNSVLSIGQQRLIEWRLKNAPQPSNTTAANEPSAKPAAGTPTTTEPKGSSAARRLRRG